MRNVKEKKIIKLKILRAIWIDHTA
jgi:hypothetical protein